MTRLACCLFRLCLYLTATAALAVGGRLAVDFALPSPGAAAAPAPPPLRRVSAAEAQRIRTEHRSRCAAARAELRRTLRDRLAAVPLCFERGAGRAEAYADWATGLGTGCRSLWRSTREVVGAAEQAPDGTPLTARQLFEGEFARQVLSAEELDRALAEDLETVRQAILAREIELSAQAEADATAALRIFVLRADAANLAHRVFGPCRSASTSFLPRVALARLGYEVVALAILQPIAAALVAATLEALGVTGGATLLGVGAGWWTAGLSIVAVVGVDLVVAHYAKGKIADRIRAELRGASLALVGGQVGAGALVQAILGALDAEMDRFEGESNAALGEALAP